MTHVRWGLVGAGDIVTRRIAPALQQAPRSQLVAVSRRKAELAERFAHNWGIPRWHARWEDLVRDADLDAVYVATPVDFHAPVAIAAAEAGKHVLCEKPMALSVAECDRMVQAADQNGVKLGIAYYRRLYPIVLRLKQLLADGAIGKPVVAQINAFEHFDPPPDHPRAWLLDPRRSGGGPMFDFGSHRIELLLNLFGAVSGAKGTHANVRYSRPVEDTAVATFQFVSGPVATVTVTHAAAEPQDTLHIFGERGSLHVPRLNGPELRIIRDGSETRETHPAPENLHQPLIEQFIAAVIDGGEPAVGGRCGTEVNRLLAQIRVA